MMASFKIQELLDAADGKLIQKGNADFVSGVSTDSRTIGEGELFIALRGDNFDGHDYVSKAVSRKAAAVMVSDLISITKSLLIAARQSSGLFHLPKMTTL